MARGRGDKVGFADLFAGPGQYTNSDGVTEESIPILVCSATVRDELFRRKVHLWFNDGDRDNYQQLKRAIDGVSGVETLQYRPTVGNKIIDATWVNILKKLRVPTLVFLDPCGYKGLSLRLISSILAGFGNDCIFFFNYSRVNMKLDLQIMNRSVDEFFEPGRARALRAEIKNRSASEREEIILAAVTSSINEAGAIPLFFRFKSDLGRTSHHLVYASKDHRAAGMMKSILGSASPEVHEGVGSGEHNPRARETSGSFFAGLYEIEERLLSIYIGREISFGALLLEEAKTRYPESNYRDAVLKLENEGRVIVDPPAQNRRMQAGGQKRTLPKSVIVRFVHVRNHGN